MRVVVPMVMAMARMMGVVGVMDAMCMTVCVDPCVVGSGRCVGGAQGRRSGNDQDGDEARR
jgi:hypothetical protein